MMDFYNPSSEVVAVKQFYPLPFTFISRSGTASDEQNVQRTFTLFIMDQTSRFMGDTGIEFKGFNQAEEDGAAEPKRCSTNAFDNLRLRPKS
jgi:hypothetical protein